MRHFENNTIVKHFKGKCYQILGEATHSETKEEMVVYKALYRPYGVFVRPKEMFYSKVDHEKYPDCEQEYRFEKLFDPVTVFINDVQIEEVDE